MTTVRPNRRGTVTVTKARKRGGGTQWRVSVVGSRLWRGWATWEEAMVDANRTAGIPWVAKMRCADGR